VKEASDSLVVTPVVEASVVETGAGAVGLLPGGVSVIDLAGCAGALFSAVGGGGEPETNSLDELVRGRSGRVAGL